MANYYATIRTNYFSVKDEMAFRELMAKAYGQDTVHLFEQVQDDGSIKFGFGCNGGISGIFEPDDEECDDTAMDRFLDTLQQLVCADDAIIITAVGNEKLCYVIGIATLITSRELQFVDLRPITLELAQHLLGNAKFQTQMNY